MSKNEKSIITKGISFNPDVLKMIDEARGDIPRSTYINNVMKKHLENNKYTKK